MRNKPVSTLILSGEDARRFASSIFKPTKEEIAEHSEIIDKINSSVSIELTEYGFEAEIKDLDLSFLDE